VPPVSPARADSVAGGLGAGPGPETAGKIWCCSQRPVPAAQQAGDQVLCPGNIATAGREWAGTVTRLGSIDHGELRRLLGRAPDPVPAASRA